MTISPPKFSLVPLSLGFYCKKVAVVKVRSLDFGLLIVRSLDFGLLIA